MRDEAEQGRPKRRAGNESVEPTPIQAADHEVEPAVIQRTPVTSGAGTLCPEQLTLNPDPVTGVNDDIGLHVSDSNRQKILNGEYLDLSVLLPKNVNNTEPSHKVSIVDGELVVQPKTVKGKINDINSWTDAFNIYMSIFLTTHPEHTQGLLKYMQSVRLGASRSNGMGWKQYDEQYRLRKARYPSAPWGVIDTELWLLYMQAPAVQRTVPSNNPANSSTLKCYDFNYKGNCSRPQCRYKHICLRCNGNHPSARCYSSSQSNGNPFRFRANQLPSPQTNTSKKSDSAKPLGSGKVPN